MTLFSCLWLPRWRRAIPASCEFGEPADHVWQASRFWVRLSHRCPASSVGRVHASHWVVKARGAEDLGAVTGCSSHLSVSYSCPHFGFCLSSLDEGTFAHRTTRKQIERAQGRLNSTGAMNACVQVSVFGSLKYLSRSGFAGSYGMVLFI